MSRIPKQLSLRDVWENGECFKYFHIGIRSCFLFTEVQRGNLKRAIELFDKAIPLTNTELEMAHLFGLRDAAIAQINVSTKLGISLPSLGLMG